MIDQIIDGEYKVLSLIGKGGFGVVYKCEEINLGRIVAIKMLNPQIAGEKELQRFLGEGRNLASLNHPNVVQIYRLGTYANQPYIVMEYLEGRTLRNLLRDGRPPIGQGLEIMRQVATGLAVVHARGIVHRDLSSNNIMILESGVVKILDLGLSKDVQTLSTMSVESFLAGTIPYISPEQIEGLSVTSPADIFSVGVMLYEIVTGRNPFEAEHFMSVLYNIAHREAVPVATLVPDVPPPLARLVEQCMEKRPEDRPASAQDVAAALANIIEAGRLSGVDSTVLTIAAPSGPARSVPNPYLNRVMIKRREGFFGRKQEIKRIYARLNATPPGSVSIVGDRKIGKSSLMNYIYMRKNREEYLDQPEKTVMVFLDLQEQHRITLESFIRTMIGMADYELRGRLQVADCAISLDGIKDLVQRLERAGYRLGILLDEFEAITRNSNFELEFFSFLRYLANHYDVAYLTSSARDLQVLCHTREISDSPFFNIFSTLRLGGFKEEEAEELIRIPSERMGVPLATYREEILDMAGLFPFFIQIACCHAIETIEEGTARDKPDFGEVRRRFFEEAKLHYRYVWEGLDDDERSAMLRVAKGKPIPDSLRHVVEELSRRYYVVQEGEKPRLFASTFDEFVKRTASEGRRPSFLMRLRGGGAK
jgi:serine/threonine protein kinase